MLPFLTVFYIWYKNPRKISAVTLSSFPFWSFLQRKNQDIKISWYLYLLLIIMIIQCISSTVVLQNWVCSSQPVKVITIELLKKSEVKHNALANAKKTCDMVFCDLYVICFTQMHIYPLHAYKLYSMPWIVKQWSTLYSSGFLGQWHFLSF